MGLNGPDNNLYKQITKQHAPSTSLQTFAPLPNNNLASIRQIEQAQGLNTQ